MATAPTLAPPPLLLAPELLASNELLVAAGLFILAEDATGSFFTIRENARSSQACESILEPNYEQMEDDWSKWN